MNDYYTLSVSSLINVPSLIRRTRGGANCAYQPELRVPPLKAQVFLRPLRMLWFAKLSQEQSGFLKMLNRSFGFKNYKGISMGFNWFQWISIITLNKLQLISILFQWISIDSNGSQLISIDLNRFHLMSMDFNGSQWISMYPNGFP